ncbi:MAG: sulfatase-like hydrolase/transferase [Firmicutes bacterium]|nr:sulfatase-like hydrolase/transferase [Bacillota bacterium]
MQADEKKKREKEKKPARRRLSLAGFLLVALFGAVSGALSLGIATGAELRPFFLLYFREPVLLLLNIAPVVLLHLMVYMIFGRPWLSFFLSTAAVFTLAYAEGAKISSVSDVIWLSDIFSGEFLQYINEASKIHLDLLCIGCLVYLVAVTTLLLVMFLRRRSPWFWGRVLLLAVLVAGGFFGFRYVRDSAEFAELSVYKEQEAAPEHVEYAAKGFWFPLMLSAQYRNDMEPPGGYSADKAKEMLARYEKEDIPDDRAVSIIALQLEAFEDFSYTNAAGVDFASAYADYNYIKARSAFGRLASDAALNDDMLTQRQVLTGCSAAGAVRENTGSYVWYLRSQGYETRGIQTCSRWLDGRGRINSCLGFEDFRYLGNGIDIENRGEESAYPDSDWFLYNEVYDTWRKGLEGGNGRQFIFAASTQNHAPYDTQTLRYGSYTEGIAGPAVAEISNYLGSVKDSFFYIRSMLDRMEADAEPVVVLIYSDHRPEFYDAYEVFGTDTAAKDAQSVLEMHSTSYLIWANSAAKKTLGSDMKGDKGYVSAEYLMARLFELCGWKGPALMQASSEAAAALPVTLSGGISADAKGTVYVDGAPLELQSRLYDLRYMQYYEQTNFRY